MANGSRKGRVLTIQQIFLLLAILNGIVVSSLFFSAWQLLNDQSSSIQHAATTSFLAALLVVGVAISYRIVSVRVIGPLSRLVRQSYAIASDEHQSGELLAVRGNDEIARLAEAFNAVLLRQRQAIDQVDSANRRLREVNKQVDDSIRYAALLQKSILPDRQLSERFGQEHFVLWQPRDTVGGDYYVFHGDGARCLAGVADCAGHGVPGAMMTMLARAGIDRSIQQAGIDSPAAVLQATNAGMHLVLSEAQLTRAIATSMDVGLVFLDFDAQVMRFAGAKISLYWSDGHSVEMAKGDNRSLWDRRAGTYHDHQIPLRQGFTYYMATDGVFDQAGGDHGFGLGTDRFRDWLLDHAGKPLSEQHEAFTRSLSEFMGDQPQRDDITMLSFRVA
ncbi:MAG: SpoIIE family protein phosphatase [Cyanobacteriota bacterium]|nr:SpoIIE family protein phosphatase [Cyanobacteriota bacterium]